MLYGALWCIGGIVVTAVTYSTALVRGGTYYLFWGAILFGFLQFFQGLFQFLDAPKQDINISKAEELVFIIETDQDWMKQLDAAEALARLKDTRGLDYLKKSLESSNADVREVAREILDELSNISDQTVKPKST